MFVFLSKKIAASASAKVNMNNCPAVELSAINTLLIIIR